MDDRFRPGHDDRVILAPELTDVETLSFEPVNRTPSIAWSLRKSGDTSKANGVDMLQPTDAPLDTFVNSFEPGGEYVLREVRLDILDTHTAVFRAKLDGPLGSPVWARAWISNEVDGTLAEAASNELTAGDDVILTVKLKSDKTPELACIRIESAPLATKHTMHLHL